MDMCALKVNIVITILLKDTRAMIGARTHTPELEFDALNHSALTLRLIF